MVRSKTPFLWEGRTFVLPQRGQSLWCRMRPLFGRSTDFRKRDRGKHNRGSKSSKQLRFEFTEQAPRNFLTERTKVAFRPTKTKATPPAWPTHFSHFILSAWPSQMARFHSSF